MKKTLITLLALAGVAIASEPVTFNTNTTITLSNAAILGEHTTSMKWEVIDSKTEAETSLTNLLKEETYSVLTTNNAWYCFSGEANTSVEDGDYSFTNDTHVLGKKTGGNQGTLLTYTLNVSELFSSSYTADYEQTITGVTFTTTTSSLGDNYYTAFVISSDGTATCLREGVGGNSLSNTTLSASNLELSADDKLMILYRQGNNTKTTITGLSIAATGSAALIPEPTTATLSLLALAGLAARRRRR